MSYIDLEKHPVEQAPFVFHGVAFDDVNPEEDELPLRSQICEEHYKNYQIIFRGALAGACEQYNSSCGVYGCENKAKYKLIF